MTGPPYRLAIDVREWVADRVTGIARYLTQVMDALAATPGDLMPILFGNQRTRIPPRFAGLATRVIPESLTLWWDQVTLPRALARARADVFLSPYYKAPLLAPCPVVVTIHDLLFLHDTVYPQRGRRRLHGALFRPWARAIASRAAAVVTDSEYSRGDIVRRLRLPADTVRVVPLGVPSGLRRVEDAAARQRVSARYGLATAYVLYVGNFSPHKNLRRLVRAFARLPAALRDAHELVLAGALDARAEALRHEVLSLGFEQRVRFPGLVDEADLAALYSGATAFVFPSLDEGFGMPPLEAMACGTPVICSTAASLPEVTGGAALLVDPASEEDLTAALRRLLEDAALRRKLGAEGLARAAEFTAARSGAVLLDLLRGVAARPRG